MQITNSVVCCASKGCIYKQIEPPLVGEHAFPLTGFVCKEAHVTGLISGERLYYRFADGLWQMHSISVSSLVLPG